MPITVRPATDEDADLIGALTERVYRDGGYLDDDEDYVTHLRDGAGRVRDAGVLVAELDGAVVASVTVAEPGTPWAEISRPDEIEVRMLAVADTARRRGIADRRGYVRRPERDWDVDGFPLIAYRLALR